VGDEARGSTRRDPAPRGRKATVIAHPRIAIVESAEAASRPAMDDALELLVKWAVRAHRRRESAAGEAPSDKNSASYGLED
jgi:hypothetical protein